MTEQKLEIKENQEIFDNMFQMYQKGQLNIDMIYNMFNINEEQVHEEIHKGMI